MRAIRFGFLLFVNWFSIDGGGGGFVPDARSLISLSHVMVFVPCSSVLAVLVAVFGLFPTHRGEVLFFGFVLIFSHKTNSFEPKWFSSVVAVPIRARSLYSSHC